MSETPEDAYTFPLPGHGTLAVAGNPHGLMKTKILPILAGLLLSVAGISGDGGRSSLETYPVPPGMRLFIAAQSRGEARILGTNVLTYSTFPLNGRFALQYMVNSAGNEVDVRISDFFVQASHGRKLTPVEMEKLSVAIKRMPAEPAPPPIHRAVITSFRSGTNWVTRIYDSERLPESLQTIIGIIGVREEARSNYP